MKTTCKRCKHSVTINKCKFKCYKIVSINKKKAQKCRWEVSENVESFVEKSKLSNKTLFCLIYSFPFLNPPHQSLIQTNLHLHPATIVDWFSLIQEVIMIPSVILSKLEGLVKLWKLMRLNLEKGSIIVAV